MSQQMNVIAKSAIAKLNAYGPVSSPGCEFWEPTPRMFTITVRRAVPSASNERMMAIYFFDLSLKSILVIYK